jgi:hypothetical protein
MSKLNWRRRAAATTLSLSFFAVILLAGCAITGNLSTDQPSKALIVESLRDFKFDVGYGGTQLATIVEAKKMLQHMGATTFSQQTSSYVSSVFGSGAEITIWPNTYNKAYCYGIRYGTPDATSSYFGSNDTYFEIDKSP